MFDSIQFSGYKSFSPQEQAILSHFGYLNLIIGKNNSGKSSVLDVIGAAFSANAKKKLPAKVESLFVGFKIEETVLRDFLKSFRIESKSALKFVGELIWAEPIIEYHGFDHTKIKGLLYNYNGELNSTIHYFDNKWDQFISYLSRNSDVDHLISRISAERNIVPEQVSENGLQPDGTGATNLIRKIVTQSKYNEQWIEEELKTALNQIMGCDAQFDSIRVQEIETAPGAEKPLWEVFLKEKGFDRFPLSQSGSGLKTIILVLLHLLIMPKMYSKKPFVFCFEELENNLHPALQRRLFDYIYQYAVEHKTPVFITSHSHVAINMFFKKEHASLFHVIKNNGTSTIKEIENYSDKIQILEDLDIKASDLLQANGIIWVEGPSDRVYIKRWLEVFGGNDIVEGTDYQFAYYGGRLLSHYSAEENAKGLINILLINRNSAIIMDSDKKRETDQINGTKKRVISEFEEKKLFSWVTAGKEIENYLSVNAIRDAIGAELGVQCQQYEVFPDFISAAYPRFAQEKVSFANKIRPHIERENILDLENQIQTLYQEIKKWNE